MQTASTSNNSWPLSPFPAYLLLLMLAMLPGQTWGQARGVTEFCKWHDDPTTVDVCKGGGTACEVGAWHKQIRFRHT